jgi:hypothetical protein
MATHFLDIRGKIADAEAILETYKDALSDAIRRGDKAEQNRYKRLIEEKENYIEGLRQRLTFGDA